MQTEAQSLKDNLSTTPLEDSIQEINTQIEVLERRYDEGRKTLEALSKAMIPIHQKVEMIKLGMLLPAFRFDDSEILKEEIKEAHQRQFEIIKSGKATESYSNWTWFGSSHDGAKMVAAYNRLLLKAYNAEFEMIRKQMRYSTYDTACEKLERLSDQLSKLAETVNANISEEYREEKREELFLWYRELKRKDQLKKDRKRQQSELRNQNKNLGVDPDEIEEDLEKHEAELEVAKQRAKKLIGRERAELEKMIARIETEKLRLEQKFQRAISQAQITRSGYIYVISNKGSFGSDVVKIGMTRRLEPMERIIELGGASVPFRFDVHTLAYTSDAPNIEKKLHDKFRDVRLNVSNERKEFFRASPNEVNAVMNELGIESDWYYDVEAREFNESNLIRKAINEKTEMNSNLTESFPFSI